MFVKPQAHMVGSVPAAFADYSRAAIDGVAKRLEPYLVARTGGEEGRSETWILGIMDATAKRLGVQSDNTQIKDYSELKPAEGGWAALTLDESLLPFEAEADRVFEATRALQVSPRSHLRRLLPVQVGVTHWVDQLAFTLGDDALDDSDIRVAFKQLHASVIRTIHAKYGDRVIFQIESPYSLRQVANAAPEDQGRVAKRMAEYIHDIVELAPQGAKFVVHLCRGDLKHESWPTEDDSLRPVVALANAVVDGWPAGRELAFVHLPLRKAQDLPSLDRRFYRPLAHLSSHGRFAAGIISERVGFDHNIEALTIAAEVYHGDAPPEERIFEAAGGPCGGGRMSFREYVDWLEQYRLVMEALQEALRAQS